MAMKKVKTAREANALEQIPNIGPSLAGDLRLCGISAPAQLVGQNPFALYDNLCHRTGVRHDPCVLDTFISAVRFMEGAPPHPWWYYTDERKVRLAVDGQAKSLAQSQTQAKPKAKPRRSSGS